MPSVKPSSVLSRSSSITATSEYCTIGPAISCGKQLT